MKINVFSYVFWPEQFLINEMVETLSQNHEVHVLTGLPNYPKGELYPGYSLDKGPYKEGYGRAQILRYPVLVRKKGFFRLALNYLSNLIGAFARQYYLPRATWAFVFATSPITTALPAIFWAQLSGAKVCIWLQDLWPDSVVGTGAATKDSLIYKALKFLVRLVYKKTDLMLIQSPAFEKNLKEYGYKGPTYFIPNWAPGIDFSKVKNLEWLPPKSDHFIVTFAGNLGKAQALDTIVAAAKQLGVESNIQFFIVGDGSEFERILVLTEKEKINNIKFFGRRPLEDMPSLFHYSDALLVSLNNEEIFTQTIPSKIQAYMAAGKPLIASMNGVGANVIRQARCGNVAPAEDSAALVRAVLQLSKKSEIELEELGNNARSYFYENFQKSKIIEQILLRLEQHA